MPKISAPTVPEHRAAQRATLVAAGEQILLDGGLAAVSPRTVAGRARMARSSFYDYFATKDDLLVAIAIDAIERWDRDVEAGLAGVPAGTETLRTYIGLTMAMTAQGRHAIAGVLRDAKLQPTRYDDLMALHQAVLRPLTRVLDALGLPGTGSEMALAQGVLDAGMQLVTRGKDHRTVAADVYRMLTRGLLGGPPTPDGETASP